MTTNPKIPFLDLIMQHLALEEELLAVFRSTLKTANFVGGANVEEFEHDFAKFCDTKYCVGVGSGTDAVRFALIAAGVQPGESVITVPNTFIATTEAISQVGAIPEFVDIDECTYNMDPEKLREHLETKCDIDKHTRRPISRRTGRTITAVVPVHLYGRMADMDPILQIAEAHGLFVIEDACQAHGAEYFSSEEQRWRKAGAIGTAAAFSFYPGKNLGACGEAGAITTNDSDIAQKVRMLRDHGQAKKYCHDIEGYNGRLDSLQAGVLTAKLKHLPEWNRKRREIADRYRGLFLRYTENIVLSADPCWSRSAHHLCVIRTRNREQLQKHLAESGVGTAIHYPVPLHLQRAYRTLGFKLGDFPITEKCSAEILSLPIYPGLTSEQQDFVVLRSVECIREEESTPSPIASASSFRTSEVMDVLAGT